MYAGLASACEGGRGQTRWCAAARDKHVSRGKQSISVGVGDRALSEVDAKALLRRAGLATQPEFLARSANEVAAEFAAPVALKVVSPQILHKTEIGGVLLGVSGESAMRDACMTFCERATRDHPDFAPDRIRVSPMAPPGVEVILGAVYDPTFDPVVMLSFGGATAELFRDTEFRAAPLDKAEALRMIEETHVWRMLQGWRGAPPGEGPALVGAVSAVSRLALGLGEFLESIELSPATGLGRQGSRRAGRASASRCRTSRRSLCWDGGDLNPPGVLQESARSSKSRRV